MKRWLITAAAAPDLDALAERLAALGATMDRAAPPIPLDEGEMVVEAEGPDDLPQLASAEPSVYRVSPNSEMTPYAD